MQSLGGFLLYFTVYAQQGFRPTTLFYLRETWENDNVNDLEDNYGQEWVSVGCLCQPHVILASSHCPARTGAEPTCPHITSTRQTVGAYELIGLGTPVGHRFGVCEDPGLRLELEPKRSCCYISFATGVE